MIKGLYTSGLGMTTQMQKLDIVANNIANADTTGFKKDFAVTQSFSEELLKRLDDPLHALDNRHDRPVGNITYGIAVNNVYTDFSRGSLRTTDNPLDVAVVGEGFFAVNVTGGNGAVTEKYTRDGSFTLSADGYLVTADGHRVLGVNGAIRLPEGMISIDHGGNISVDSVFIDRLKTVSFVDFNTLRKYGDNLYDTTEQSCITEFSGELAQGVLENSNISVVREMVEMIAINRNYEANSKLVTMHDQILGRTVTDIGRKV